MWYVRYCIGAIITIAGVVWHGELEEISFGNWQLWLSWVVIFIGYNIGIGFKK